MLARQNTGWLTFAVADCTLFLTPLTTSLSPRIMASKPVVAAVAASSLSAVPTLLSTMSARRKNSVSVAPGIRQVTLTFVSCSSSRMAKENESMNALVPL